MTASFRHPIREFGVLFGTGRGISGLPDNRRELTSGNVPLTLDLLDLAGVLRGYLACALWTAYDSDGCNLDARYDTADFHPDSVATHKRQLQQFLAVNAGALEGLDPDQVGHDIWLDRNLHGTGFTDRGLESDGQVLSDAAQHLGEADVYIGDDGRLHIS